MKALPQNTLTGTMSRASEQDLITGRTARVSYKTEKYGSEKMNKCILFKL